MSQANGSWTIIATLLTTILMEKYKFQTMYYGMIHGLLLSMVPLMTLDYFNFFQSFDVHYLSYLVILPIFYVMYWVINKYFTNDYLTINLYNRSHLIRFTKYITLQKEYYPEDINTEYGDIDSLLDNKMGLYSRYIGDEPDLNRQINEKIEFDDKFLNITGYYMWKKKVKDQLDKDKNVIRNASCNYIELNIIKLKGKKIIPNEILDKMRVYINDKTNTITQCYYKILSQKDKENQITPYAHNVDFYDGEKRSFDVLEKQYIKTLFHPKRDELWEMIKNNILNPEFYRNHGQVGRVSLLFYGPPGTGKSTFAYRIAMCLYRHIISLDLRILKKQELYTVLNKPGKLTSYSEMTYDHYVYLFEEFDISIKYLHCRQMDRNRKKNEFYNAMEFLYNMQQTGCIVNKQNVDEMNNDNADRNEIKKDGNGKDETKKDETQEDNLISCERDEFTLRDLLEIFQGPVPFEGMVMLASTNKYEDIKKLCPELFRSGRMTPVYFGYIDKKTLQEISMHFFKKKLGGYLPNEIKIPTSEIIEIALESSQQKCNQFDIFSKKIQKLLDNQ